MASTNGSVIILLLQSMFMVHTDAAQGSLTSTISYQKKNLLAHFSPFSKTCLRSELQSQRTPQQVTHLVNLCDLEKETQCNTHRCWMSLFIITKSNF